MKHANQLKPNQSDVVLVYFEALARNNQKDAGEKMLLDFINQQKTFAAAYDRLYYQYMVDKQFDDAERILKLKVQNNPKSANYLLQLATHYVIVVNRRPDMDAVIHTLTDEKQFPDGHLMAGDFYLFRLREFELAKQQYEAGMAALPKDKAVYQKRLVELYATSGSNAEANQMVDTLLKENPKDSDAIAMHAALLLTSGKPDQVNQAAIDLQGLVAKNPNNHLLRFNYARALLAKTRSSRPACNWKTLSRLARTSWPQENCWPVFIWSSKIQPRLSRRPMTFCRSTRRTLPGILRVRPLCWPSRTTTRPGTSSI